ncbi:hypothetical protein DFH11DRAFT_1851863 [Phellopilus nigrolimitatus]|nr:hypothetical protein DFH11DRAFT_1851863 [Phellopilus nigrolimitatus]
MVNFVASLVGTALAFQVAFAAPYPDSSLGDEVGVSAPDGIPITNTAELAKQSSMEAMSMGMGSDMGMGSGMAMTSSPAAMATSMMEASSSPMMEASSSPMMEASSSAMMAAPSSSMMMDSTATMSAAMSMNTMSYGSGSSNWGGSGYNSCVQQCVASFGAPMATYSPSTASSSSNSSGSMGTGATHTVIVAPSQGVLRYVPFATNASVGDTIKFMWGANMHTVTKSSQLEICNKTSAAPFASGTQNKSFVFTQMVNSTDPTFFYCGVPTHCQKGMFGIINPPSALAANTSVASMMPALASNSSDVAAMAMMTQNMTQGSQGAAAWGGSIDMASMPAWSYNMVAENVMYSRSFLAANPDVLQSDGSVNLGASSAPLMIPQDLSAMLAASSASPSSAASPTAGNPSGAASTAAENAGSSPSASASTSTSGARGLVASSVLASIVALVAAAFAL